MNRNVIAIFILLVGVALYPFFIEPQWQKVQTTRQATDELKEVIGKTEELVTIQQDLESKVAQISAGELAKIEQLLPGEVDPIRRMLDLQNLALANGLILTGGSDPSIQDPDTATGLSLVTFDLSLRGTYQQMKQFVKDLSESLTLLDVTNLAFAAPGQEEGQSTRIQDITSFSITIQLYQANNTLE